MKYELKAIKLRLRQLKTENKSCSIVEINPNNNSIFVFECEYKKMYFWKIK